MTRQSQGLFSPLDLLFHSDDFLLEKFFFFQAGFGLCPRMREEEDENFGIVLVGGRERQDEEQRGRCSWRQYRIATVDVGEIEQKGISILISIENES